MINKKYPEAKIKKRPNIDADKQIPVTQHVQACRLISEKTVQ